MAKGANLASGVKVTDVNMEKQKAAETRDALLEITEGSPNIRQFTNLYAKKEALGKLTPAEIEIMRKWNELNRQSKAWHKAQLAAQPQIGARGY